MGICLNAFPLPGSNLLESSNCTDLSRPFEVGSSHLEHMLPGTPTRLEPVAPAASAHCPLPGLEGAVCSPLHLTTTL